MTGDTTRRRAWWLVRTAPPARTRGRGPASSAGAACGRWIPIIGLDSRFIIIITTLGERSVANAMGAPGVSHKECPFHTVVKPPGCVGRAPWPGVGVGVGAVTQYTECA